MGIEGASPNYIAVSYVWKDKCMVKVHQCCFIYGFTFIIIPISFATLVLTGFTCDLQERSSSIIIPISFATLVLTCFTCDLQERSSSIIIPRHYVLYAWFIVLPSIFIVVYFDFFPYV